ncbi:class I SAM-dependent methyltransferase [Roseovarius faecimaris]|uniref:Class I SAM-dependent methyltransferase n=1 Tax=Roseovarius faecimaris TaxID=2494550 RepID=A0A6I6ILD8_9RHOB|nr:class I SAM-dependent methyltransferase [Roseovarius faecimaris]QGX96874.1 class I SAM-dependent methyltransferase [Roseovarius faecimaris]
MAETYDRIGKGYATRRKPDARIAAVLHAALGDAQSVVNVGAGAGSYEPDHCEVVAAEPSAEMIAQRPKGSAPVVQASAEELPFDDRSFDAAMAVLTVHHWRDKAKGMAEMRRVTKGPVVILTYDPGFRDFWLLDYFPGLIALDEGQMPKLSDYEAWLGSVEITPVPIPQDCTDGFLSAYWRRPWAYLDDTVRAAMSPFWALGDVSRELAQLRDDLESGAWESRYGKVMTLTERDCGYRLVVAR